MACFSLSYGKDWMLKSLWTVVLVFLSQGVLAADSVEFTKDNARVTIKADGHTVLVYKYGEVPYKPYVEQFCTPSGVNVLRDAPSDHLHHHGLMFAIRVDDVNFWEERNDPGTQKTIDLTEVKTHEFGGVNWTGFTSHIDWTGPKDGKTLLKEERVIEVALDQKGKASGITWTSTFSLPEGKPSATLTGTNYHGLGMRFLPSMDTGGSFMNSEGKTGVEGTNDARANWCSYTALADGKEVTVVMLDHSSNPRHPATWFTMTQAFAYLSSTLNLAKEPFEIKAPESLTLRYALILGDGKIEASKISDLYSKWTALPLAK
jgi:hypothetical protein